MISEEVLEKIAERKGIPKEKLEQALIDVSEGKEKQTSMLELLDELPKEKIKKAETKVIPQSTFFRIKNQIKKTNQINTTQKLLTCYRVYSKNIILYIW
jgi:predicted transcriptional regulator